MSESNEPVWSLIMFDLPVKSKIQRKEAADFRNLLLDQGYEMAQFSVYARFSPSVHTLIPTLGAIKRQVPAGGEVRILTVSDHQWSKTLRYTNALENPVDDHPLQLTIF